MKKLISSTRLVGLICSVALIMVLVINATAVEQTGHIRSDFIPVVDIQKVELRQHQIMISGFGEIAPYESTQLSSELSGKVIQWNPEFTPGGVIKKGELLFKIESDTYHARVLRSKENYAMARTRLIEERAKADVAAKDVANVAQEKISALYLREPQLLQAQRAVDAALAELELAERMLDECNVVAPFDSLVVRRDIGKGQFVNVGQTVALLHNIEFAEIHVPIAGFDAAFLPDQISDLPAKVESATGASRQVHISRDLGIVDSITRMRKVVVKVDDPYGIATDKQPMRFGEFVEVSFPGKQITSAYKVPRQSLVDQGVWLINKDNQLKNESVSVLRSEPGFYLVKGDLGNTALIVTSLPDFPIEGTIVNPRSPASPVL
mmetsp:Transcript_14080/g.36327  ORF Transcript_14080/g.36327 Transcript_14080/m.36327 type:complete len:379 (-) Transcript_14080:6777-7913(-)